MRSETPTIALAGYTNVGKSTLLNALTGADASVDDRLFETLDPTTRAFEHEGRRYLVTDTVGFIRRLPHQLVEGFAATLEETLVADLVLHVADASAADERARRRWSQAVESVLAEIGAGELPIELVLNKIDAARPARHADGSRTASRARSRSRRGPARGSTSCARESPSGSASASRSCELLVPYERRRAASPSCTRSGRRSRSAPTAPTASSSARGCREREVRRFAPFLVADAAARPRVA